MSPKPVTIQLRRGFTLLELLVVIAIIGILASLTISVMNGVTDQALREATKATVQKVNGLLQQRIESFDRSFTGERREQAIKNVRNVLETAIIAAQGNPFLLSENETAMSILAKKLEFRFQFPQRVQDRLGAPYSRDPQATGTGSLVALPPGGVPLPQSLYEEILFPVARAELLEEQVVTLPLDASERNLIDARVSQKWTNHDRDTESSELLYFALIRSRIFGASVSGADEFSGSEIGDTDNDGLPEFVDAWGTPLQFYRWPTRLIDNDSPVPFDPVLSNLNDPTDLRTSSNPTGRQITDSERRVAGILLKGLPPAPGTISAVQQREFLLVDPDDPVGIVYQFLEDPTNVSMGINLHNYINEDTFHTIDTFHTPLIVSAGVDGITGLYEPWRTETGILGILAQPAGTNFTSASTIPTQAVEDAMRDNVTNRNRRAGGQR